MKINWTKGNNIIQVLKNLSIRKRIILLVILFIVLGLSFFLCVSKKEVQETSTIEAGIGQIIMYAKITAINGNDMEVVVLEKEEDSSDTEENGEDEHATEDMPQMSQENMGNQKMNSMPDQLNGEEQGFDTQSDLSKESMKDQTSKNNTNSEMQSMTMYIQTSEAASLRIPVGTDVVTKLGAVTTFTHLDVDDTIAILLQENSNEIMKIWIVQ